MEVKERPNSTKKESHSMDGNLPPDASSDGRKTIESTSAGEVGQSIERDCDDGMVLDKEKCLPFKEKQKGNDKTDLAICSDTVSSSITHPDGKITDEDDNCLDIVGSDVSGKDNSDDDYVSDEDSHESMDDSEAVPGTSNMATESVTRASCKRRQPMKYQRRTKKRKFKNTQRSTGNDDNLQPSTSSGKVGERTVSKPVKIPFRFSPKKSCSGSRFKRKLQENRRKKLRFRLQQRKGEVSYDTSDDECGFGINDELEETLESHATKNNLTAINVKSILHHVITNEHVLAMVRNTMLDEEKKEQLERNQCDGEQEKMEESEEAHFEPKMTRSKLKKAVQQAGNAPYVWPLSPVKGKKVVPQFAELNFPEDSEDDEDYKPDPNEKDESDHESYLSSQVSDFGSPSPFTPLSQNSFKEESPFKDEKKNQTKGSEKASVSSDPNLKVISSPVQPSSSTPQPVNEDGNFMMMLDEMDKELDSMSQNTLGTDIIAKRTRSKLTIENSLDEIEASFIAPDITADMYDSDCEDNREWKEWLNDLFKDKKDNELNDTFDDEQNDPDFNFMADEEEVNDTEETRTDRAVRVSKKELNVLLDELLESYGDETSWNDPVEVPRVEYNPPKTLAAMLAQMRSNPATVASSQSTTNVPKQAVKVIPIVTPSERLQLQQQMQQHVQLLCQLNLLGRGDVNYNREAEQAKMFLNELNMLGGNTPTDGSGDEDAPTKTAPSTSAFIACNLKGALEIVNNWSDEEEGDDDSGKRKKKYADASTGRHYNAKQVPMDAKISLMSSIVFMYTELLPHHGLLYQPSSKPVFVASENHLIVLGLRQFHLCDNKFRLIQKHMIPGKTVKQIQSRIKNFCTKKKFDNTIKNYRKHNTIPDSVNPCRPVLPGQEVAPIFQFPELLPDWMKNLRQSSLMKLERDLEKERETEERTRKAVLASVNELNEEKKEISRLPKKKKRRTPEIAQGSGCPLPVAIVQNINGQIVQLIPNQMLPSNSGTLPTFINVLPQPFTLPQQVPLPQQETVVTGISVPTSITSDNNVIKQNIEVLNVNPVENSQQGTSQTTAVTPSSRTPSTTVSSSQPTTVQSLSTVQLLPAIHVGTSVPQPAIIMIPPNAPTQGKFLVQQSTGNVILVQDNPNTLNVNDIQAVTSEVSQQHIELNDNDISSSFQTSLVPSKSELIQLSPGKHGQVIKFGGRQSLVKDSKQKSEVPEKGIMTSCFSKGEADGISALKRFQIYQTLSDKPQAKQEAKQEEKSKTTEKAIESKTVSPITFTYAVKTPKTVTNVSTPNDGKHSVTNQLISLAVPQTTNKDEHSGTIDVEVSQLDTEDNPCVSVTSNVAEVSPVPMEPVQSSGENAQEQSETDLDISGDSGMAIEDDSVHRYNEDDDDEIDVEVVTGDEEDIVVDDKEIEDDDDDFELDVVGTSDSKSSTDVKDQVTNEITRRSPIKDIVNLEDCQDHSPDEGHPIEPVSGMMSEEEMKASRKVAAKRLKSRLRKEMESTVVLLDPDIVRNDPKKPERDDIFARAYLNRVKDIFKEHPSKYLEFLHVLADFNSDDLHMSQCYERLKNLLAGQDELIEDFTAFLDPEQAVKCGVLMSHLEFSKARLFLREVEVHFQKQPGHFQKILKAIVIWGETENRTNQQLKDLLLPLLKGQPHLEQELSGLFPDEKPAETLMPDFEMAEWSEDKDFDGYEEIELPDSEDEEKHLKGKIPTGKLDIVDPWQRLNAELQYGTKRCRCSCHDRSLDSRVQKKTRHCAYCTAKVSRAELTSSFRGIASVKGRASRSTRRKVSKSQKGSRHMEPNDEEDHEDGDPCSAAVNNLSEMCSNLADYLNETACGEIEEMDEDAIDVEAEEMEEDTGDVETEEEDIEEMEMDDEEADEEVQKLMGDGFVADDDPDDPELITGADTTSSNSPDAELSSQESKGSSDSDESNIASPESKSPLSHSNSLGELHDRDRSETNSPLEYLSEDNKTDDTDNTITGIISSPEATERNSFEQIGKIIADKALLFGKSDEQKLSNGANTLTEASSSTDNERESRYLDQNKNDSMHSLCSGESLTDSVNNVVNQQSYSTSRCEDSSFEQIQEPSSVLKRDDHKNLLESIKGQLIVTLDKEKHGEKVDEIQPLVTQTQLKGSPSKRLEEHKHTVESFGKTSVETQLKDRPNIHLEENKESDETLAKTSVQTQLKERPIHLEEHNDSNETLTSVQTELKDRPNMYLEEHKDSDDERTLAEYLEKNKGSDERGTEAGEPTESCGSSEAARLRSKMSAANVMQTSDGSVIVSWTRDDDRLLLQSCQMMENDRVAFELVADKLGKSVSEVEERFNTLMKLFIIRPKSDGEESADRTDSEHSSTSDADE